MPPTRPLLIWALVAGACAAILAAEGAMLLIGRQRRAYGWRPGVSMILGSLVASALAARLSDIHAELIRTQCNCEPFQATDPRIAIPFALATVLGSLLLVLTAYGSARVLRMLRYPAVPVAERSEARAWSFLWSFFWNFFVLAGMADVGAWILANGVAHLAEFLESPTALDPANVYDGLGLLPLFDAIAASVCGALVLIVPISLILVALRRSVRAVPNQ